MPKEYNLWLDIQVFLYVFHRPVAYGAGAVLHGCRLILEILKAKCAVVGAAYSLRT